VTDASEMNKRTSRKINHLFSKFIYIYIWNIN
jgi:hypothetical protein